MLQMRSRTINREPLKPAFITRPVFQRQGRVHCHALLLLRGQSHWNVGIKQDMARSLTVHIICHFENSFVAHSTEHRSSFDMVDNNFSLVVE